MLASIFLRIYEITSNETALCRPHAEIVPARYSICPFCDARMSANLEETADCEGNWIKASIASDGKFTVTNGRNGIQQDLKWFA